MSTVVKASRVKAMFKTAGRKMESGFLKELEDRVEIVSKGEVASTKELKQPAPIKINAFKKLGITKQQMFTVSNTISSYLETVLRPEPATNAQA
jgi:hypothetical protein